MKTRHVNYGSLQNVFIREAPPSQGESDHDEEADKLDNNNLQIQEQQFLKDQTSEDEGPECVTFAEGQSKITNLNQLVAAQKTRVKTEAKLKRIKHLEQFKAQKASKSIKPKGIDISPTNKEGFIPTHILKDMSKAKKIESITTPTLKEKPGSKIKISHLPLDQVYVADSKIIHHAGGSVKVVKLEKKEYAVGPIDNKTLEYRRNRLLFNSLSMPRQSMDSCLAYQRKQHIIGFDRLAT